MRIFVYDPAGRNLTYSVVNAATMQVYSPAAKGWVDSAADALVVPPPMKDPAHKGLAKVELAGLAAPAKLGDYQLVGHDPVTTLPVDHGVPLGPVPAGSAQVINYIALTVGG